MDHDASLDALGLLCPLPVLKTAKQMRALAQGEVLRVQTDDPAALIDMPHYCAESGNALLGQDEAGAVITWYLQKK
nr:sulfurtransferase TusA family protein [Vannielia litorea]